MYELHVSAEQNRRGVGYVTIWENADGVITRVSLEAGEPKDSESEYVGKATPLLKFVAIHCGGLGYHAIKVTFDDSGVVRRAEKA